MNLLENKLIRDSEKYEAVCRYVLSTDYPDRNVLIAILGIIKETKETENK